MHSLTNQLIWITGLSGAGKTTLARALQKELKSSAYQVVLLDGDELREALGSERKDFNFEERKTLAFSYAKLAKLLSDQGFIVIVSTISMFEDVRFWNRKNNNKYCEVYLKVSKRERLARDPKKLYAGNFQVVEFEDGFEEPRNPDLSFENEEGETLGEMVKLIKNNLGIG